jgi:hypothetical protein
MPDYDPKSIPILDDIIEGENDGDLDSKSNSEGAKSTEAGDRKTIPEQISAEQIYAEQINADITAAEDIQDDSTFDLFDDSDTASTKHEPYITDTFFDDLKHDDDLTHDNVTGEDQEHDEQDNKNQSHESALIDYHTEDEDHAEDEASQDDIITIDDEISAPAISSQAMAEEPRISLNAIVDDVVKKLMPDLEQQLRFLIKQALEEKLPEGIIDGISTKNDE